MSIFINSWAQSIFTVNRENYKIHFIWFRVLCVLAMMMGLNRFVVFISLSSELPPLGMEALQIFWMGFRFDLLILGFTYLVVIAFGVLRFLFPEEIHLHAVVYLTRKYYFVVWTVISLIYYFNSWFVLSHKKHMRLEDWRHAVELKTYLVAQQFPLLVFTMISIALVVSFYVGLYVILTCDDFFDVVIEDQMHKPKVVSKNETIRAFNQFKEELSDQTPYWVQFFFFFFVPLLIAALAARGTVTANHLEYTHAQISKHSLVNELVLNPVWTFDKRAE